MPAEQSARDPSLLSIGEVLTQLRVDFPDTTISKLRFLETEGLVQPQRTPSGYRKYSGDDVARLRYVLAAQRDQYLPLRVIRAQLDDGAHVPSAPQRPALVAVRDPEPAQDPQTRLRRSELCSRAGVSEEMLADLEQHGLIAPRPGGVFDADALAVAEIAGLLAGYGIEARHLRPYKVAADREAGLFAQIVAPLLRQQAPGREARAHAAMHELMLLSQRLHLALLRSGLNDTLGP